jgi:outer membrane murein-binding lipoprotein Lpp
VKNNLYTVQEKGQEASRKCEKNHRISVQIVELNSKIELVYKKKGQEASRNHICLQIRELNSKIAEHTMSVCRFASLMLRAASTHNIISLSGYLFV